MSIKIKEVAFVFHPITDVARARKFYEGLLGLKVGMQVEFSPNNWWIEYDIAGVALAVSNAMPAPPVSSLYIEVADLDGALKEIHAAGLKPVRDIMESPVCRMVAVKDPDGNEIGLHQKKAKA